MIDHTNGKILRQQTILHRAKRRRYAFQHMLAATDRVLWRLEEMNRDAVKTVPKSVREAIRALAETMPDGIGDGLGESSDVQGALDRMFEVQERLFRWRYPDWHDFDPGDDGFDEAAS